MEQYPKTGKKNHFSSSSKPPLLLLVSLYLMNCHGYRVVRVVSTGGLFESQTLNVALANISDNFNMSAYDHELSGPSGQ